MAWGARILISTQLPTSFSFFFGGSFFHCSAPAALRASFVGADMGTT